MTLANNLKTGAVSVNNHNNQTAGLRVKTRVKAGAASSSNHNENPGARQQLRRRTPREDPRQGRWPRQPQRNPGARQQLRRRTPREDPRQGRCIGNNHNETQVRDSNSAAGLRVKTRVKAGSAQPQRNPGARQQLRSLRQQGRIRLMNCLRGAGC